MSLTVTQRPNSGGGWVAARNPIIYKMTRKDWVTGAGTTISNGGGGHTTFNLNLGVDHTADFVTGDSIYLETVDGVYSGVGTVISSSYSAPVTFIITTVPYVLANSSGGFINNFTQRSNYYVGVGVYKSTDNILIGTVNYYPNKYGDVVIDVKEPILSIIDASLPTGVLSEGFISETSYQGFYIIYTEFWTGSAESPVTDIANISYGVFGANQIGQDANVITSSFLTRLNIVYYNGISTTVITDTFKITVGEFYVLSFVDTHAYTNIFLIKSWYDRSGIFYAASYTKSQLIAAKSVYTYCQALTNTPTTSIYWYENLYPYINIVNGGTTNWNLPGTTGGAIGISAGQTSKTGCALCYFRSGSTIQLKWTLSTSGATTFIAQLNFFDSTGAAISTSVTPSPVITTTIGLNQSGIVSITPSSDIFYIGVKIVNTGGATLNVGYGATTGGQGPGLQLVIPTTYTRIDFQPVNVPAALPYATNAICNSITGNIVCSQNTITLFWRNSQGGESSWSFNYTQDRVQKLQEPFKNIWLTLYEQNLTLSQFNSLNELITLGQVYQTPLIELTLAVDKTEARIDQQVYMVDSNGVKTGVVVIAGENKTRTRNTKHQFQVTIELPEIFT